jgi:hypothetical protein
MKSPEFLLKLVLRWVGTASLLALVAVVMPHAWMDAIHQALGLGRLPDAPIVGYLARSTSAFYAFFGALLWHLSMDLPRCLPVIRFAGKVTIGFGLVLLGVDWVEGLPLAWKVMEGPMVVLIGAVISFLTARVSPGK